MIIMMRVMLIMIRKGSKCSGMRVNQVALQSVVIPKCFLSRSAISTKALTSTFIPMFYYNLLKLQQVFLFSNFDKNFYRSPNNEDDFHHTVALELMCLGYREEMVLKMVLPSNKLSHKKNVASKYQQLSFQSTRVIRENETKHAK